MSRLLPLLIVALSSHLVCADVVTITPVADTCLFEKQEDFNWGAQTEIVAGVLGFNEGYPMSRSLLKFDIAAEVPAGSTITGAQLTLLATKTPPGAPSPL